MIRYTDEVWIVHINDMTGIYPHVCYTYGELLEFCDKMTTKILKVVHISEGTWEDEKTGG